MGRFVRFNLFVAFAFTVMADPVSSVAYAIEAALDALDGDIADLVLTMALVVGIIAVVAGTYHQLIARFPGGGGGAEALAAAFGEGWAFLPLGALLVDFTLTITVSAAAGASALIAFEPSLSDYRVPLALALSVAVGAACAFGHRARVVFATATLGFVGAALAVMALGTFDASATPHARLVSDAGVGAALLAVPLGMALATGVEVPSNAIAQLKLDDRGRRLFGQLTIWIMLAVVGGITLAFAALAVRLGVGLPSEDSTLLAEIARASTGGGSVFAAFQFLSALLLLAAAASSYLAGSGLLKALALHGAEQGGLLPRPLARVNRFYAPHWGLAVLTISSAPLILLAGGRDQEIVHFYAVAVFMSFFGAVVAAARLSFRERRLPALLLNCAGIALVAFVLALNLVRLDPIVSILASTIISVLLWRVWVSRGRPGGVARIPG